MITKLLNRLFSRNTDAQSKADAATAMEDAKRAVSEGPSLSPTKLDILADTRWLSLLKQFQCAQSVEDVNSRMDWSAVIGSSADQAIRKFLQDGLIQPAPSASVFAAKFGAKELKTLAKQRSVRSSGTKADIAERLAGEDSAWVKSVVGDIDCYICTSRGVALVESFLQKKRHERETVEGEVKAALKECQFEAACAAMAAHEAQQVFTRGVGIDWQNYSSKADILFLRLLFETMPARFSGLTESQILAARVAAGMMRLWGQSFRHEWLDNAEEPISNVTLETAAEQLFHSASHRAQMDQFRESGIKRCILLPGIDPCSACLKYENKAVSLDKIPEIPLPHCTSEVCKCCVQAFL